MNFFGSDEICISPRGSLYIGEITMQRKGGTPDPTKIQFKIKPCQLFKLGELEIGLSGTTLLGKIREKKFNRAHTHILYFTKNKERFTFNDRDIRIPSARQLIYKDKLRSFLGHRNNCGSCQETKTKFHYNGNIKGIL